MNVVVTKSVMKANVLFIKPISYPVYGLSNTMNHGLLIAPLLFSTPLKILVVEVDIPARDAVFSTLFLH